jgi:hypothetical protein
MQVKLLKTFLVLTIMAIPIMVIYGTFDGYSSLSSVSFASKISFGNIGFSEALCDKNLIESNQNSVALSFTCQGSSTFSRVSQVGVFPVDA